MNERKSFSNRLERFFSKKNKKVGEKMNNISVRVSEEVKVKLEEYRIKKE